MLRTIRLFVSLAILATSPRLLADAREFWQGTSPPSRADRREAASQFLKQIVRLDDQIPELSPSQREWLKREFNDEIRKASGRYTQRSILATDSLEYNLASAKPRLAAARSALSELTSAQSPALKREVELWATVAATYADMQLATSLVGLVAKNVLRSDALDSELAFLPHTQSLKANIILVRVIVPYLQGQLQR